MLHPAGQCKELLFKMVHFELHNARLCLIHDDLPRAFVILDRSKKIFRYLGNIWDVLSTITAHGFSEFRNHLGSASGQLSFMYRHVEFILGNKSKAMAQAYRNVPHIYPGHPPDVRGTQPLRRGDPHAAPAGVRH